MTATKLSKELTTSLSDLGTVTTTKAAVATTATTPAVKEVLEPKTSVHIVPKYIKPEEVIRLAESLLVENKTIIIESTLIVKNQAIYDMTQEQVAQEVLDAADFKSSMESESTQSVPTPLAALLPESNLISVATNDSLLQAPAIVAEGKGGVLKALNDKPADVVLIFSSNVTADQIEETLNSIQESMPALELLQSASTDIALQMLPPTELMAILDLVSDLKADLDPSNDLTFIPFITNDNLAVGNLINKAASKENVAPIQAVSN